MKLRTRTASLFAGALVVLLAAAPALAQNQTYRDRPDSWGLYIGGFGGYGWTDVDATGAPSFDVDGIEYGAFAGFELGEMLDRHLNIGLRGALEGHFAWSEADDRIGGVTAKKEHEWGVSFRPGMKFISDVMPLGLQPYAILGYRRAKFEATAAGITDRQKHNGFELGIGTELVAYDNVGIRLDYSHVFYDKKNGIDPDENDLRLGLAFHF